ncbi:MAG: head-tail adaptor protein [Maricaulaceae bacterium]
MTVSDWRERVRLERRVRIADPAGGFSESWAFIAEVAASVRFLSAREGEDPPGAARRLSYEVRLRWRPGLGPPLRLMWRGRQLDVVSFDDPDGRRAQLILSCRETVP